MFSSNKATEQVNICKLSGEQFQNVLLTSVGYHIKSKRNVFSDGTEHKCLCFSQMSFWDATTYLQRKGVPFHCNTVRYA